MLYCSVNCTVDLLPNSFTCLIFSVGVDDETECMQIHLRSVSEPTSPSAVYRPPVIANGGGHGSNPSNAVPNPRSQSPQPVFFQGNSNGNALILEAQPDFITENSNEGLLVYWIQIVFYTQFC